MQSRMLHRCGMTQNVFYFFYGCSALTGVYFPASVTNIGEEAFSYCFSLTGLFFAGSPPMWYHAFDVDNFSAITFYYIPGTSGWLQLASFLQLGYWFPNPTIPGNVLNFGIQNNQFGFTIVWATNVPVIVDACTNLENPQWQPLQTNILTDSAIYFTDSQWTNYPSQFYRLRSPRKPTAKQACPLSGSTGFPVFRRFFFEFSALFAVKVQFPWLQLAHSRLCPT